MKKKLDIFFRVHYIANTRNEIVVLYWERNELGLRQILLELPSFRSKYLPHLEPIYSAVFTNWVMEDMSGVRKYEVHYIMLLKGCALYYFFQKKLNIPDSVFPRRQRVYTHRAGQTPALRQNWQSSEKSQQFKEKHNI